MGLTSHLIPALVCLLACTSYFLHGHKHNFVLEETIKTLNILTARKELCLELSVADVLTAPKNTTETEIFCRAAQVLRHVYTQHRCLSKMLSRLDRNLYSMASKVGFSRPPVALAGGTTRCVALLTGGSACANQPIHSFNKYSLRLYKFQALGISCSVNETKKSSLKDFLERLRRIMQEKYATS
ncbi:interleukin-4 [Molossus nigricans]